MMKYDMVPIMSIEVVANGTFAMAGSIRIRLKSIGVTVPMVAVSVSYFHRLTTQRQLETNPIQYTIESPLQTSRVCEDFAQIIRLYAVKNFRRNGGFCYFKKEDSILTV